MVQSLVSNGKEKSELPPTRASVSQARVPLPSARAQNVHEHVLLTPQIGRSGDNDFMKRVNNITQTSRATYASYHHKKEMEQLLHLQNEYRSTIPKLTLVKDTGTANFRQWNSAFLTYLEVMHPDLHSVCKIVSCSLLLQLACSLLVPSWVFSEFLSRIATYPRGTYSALI